MKRITLLLLSLLCVLSLASCGNTDDIVPNGYKLASDAEASDYSLYVPDGWITSNEGTFTQATVSNSDRSNISFAVVPGVENGIRTIADYWNGQKAEYEALLGESFAQTEDEQGAVVSVGGETGYRYIFTASYGGKDYKFMQIYLVHTGTLTADFYVFTYTAEADKYDGHLEAVNQILSYMKWD
jgi:hypothetical protein